MTATAPNPRALRRRFRPAAGLALAALLAAPPVLAGASPEAAAQLAATAVQAPPEAAASDPPPEAAGAPANPLFTLRPFADVATGDRLVFRVEREADPADPRLPPFDGTATVSLTEPGDGAGREAQVVIAGPDGAGQAAPPLAEAAGHPLLLVFLESTVGTMAAATGGNPAYIRSRLREALWLEAADEPAEIEVDGETHPARALSVRPFASDPARDEMGGFADLELRFLVSDAVPGRLALLQSRSDAGRGLPAITSRMTYVRLEAAEEPAE
jgi:hypothetical protein